MNPVDPSPSAIFFGDWPFTSASQIVWSPKVRCCWSLAQPRARTGKNNPFAVGRDGVCVAIFTEFSRLHSQSGRESKCSAVCLRLPGLRATGFRRETKPLAAK